MILVTGVSGFIGRHLLSALVEEYGQENILALSSVKPNLNCHYLNHSDYFFDDDFFIDKGYENIDTIIHAGSFTPKTSKQCNNVFLSNGNIRTADRLLSANLPHLKKIAFLSSIDVYGSVVPITEKSLTAPSSLYGQSKIYCENMIDMFAKQHNLTCQILRIGHVYGPGEEKYQKLIPLTISKLIEAKPIIMFGKGKAIRSFIYIDDVVRAIIKSLELESSGGVINVVGTEQISVHDLLKKVIKISGCNITIEQKEYEGIEVDSIFDSRKMTSLLGTPEVSLDDGLMKEWQHMKNSGHEDIL
jgi:UDP-glucose 4-epimerase